MTNGILQGLGLYNIPLKNAFIALIIHIIACFILLIPFNLNIYGIVIAMTIFAIVLSFLNQREINKVVRYKNRGFQRRYILTYFLMVLSAGIMAVSVYFLNIFLENNILDSGTFISLVIRLIICIFVSIFIYGFFVIMLGVVRRRDAQYIPFISKFGRLLRN